MSWFLARVAERTTWLAFGAILSVFGWKMSDTTTEIFIQAGIAVGSFILVIYKERKGEAGTIGHQENVEG